MAGSEHPGETEMLKKYHRVSKWCVAAQKPQVGAMRVLSPQNRGITAFAMIFIKPTIEIAVARYAAYKRSGDTFHTNSLEYEIVRCSSLANLLHRY